MKRTTLALSLGILALHPGCKCSNDKPYVPYPIDNPPSSSTSTHSATASAPARSASAPTLQPVDGGTFARVAAQQAPQGTSSWTLGKLQVIAPPGRTFLSGLATDPNTAVAFVSDGSSAGEVVRYTLTDNGRVVGPVTLARLPAWLPTGSNCTSIPGLSQAGPSTLWLDVTSVCQSDAHPPNRYLAAISLKGDTSNVRLDLRVTDPASGERLLFDADAGDQDNDGNDDLLVQIALEGAPAPLSSTTRTAVSLKFLSRSAGMSRETKEPAQGLRDLVASTLTLAAKRETGAQAMDQALQARRLQSMLCSEYGNSIIQMGDGSLIPCADPQLPEDFRIVEARALLTLGNPPSAFTIAAPMRDQKTKPRRLNDLDTAFNASAPIRKVTGKPLKVIPIPSRTALPISFDNQGILHVISEDGIVQVNPATGAESPSQAPRWNPLAELVGDMKVHGSGDDCKAGFQWIQIQSASPRKLPTSIPGSLGPNCTSTSNLSLLDRNADGLTVALQGSPYFIPKEGDSTQAVPWPKTAGGQGTIRSPDGQWSAFASPDRMLIHGPNRDEVWQPSTRLYLTACTVANDAKVAACLLERGVVLLTP